MSGGGLSADLPFHVETRVQKYTAPVAELLGAGTTSLDHGTLTVTYIGGSMARDGVLNRNTGSGVPSAASLLPELTLLRISMGRAQTTLVLDARGEARGRTGVGLSGATGQEVLEIELDDYSMNYRTLQASIRSPPDPSLPAASFFTVTVNSLQVPVGTWFDQLLTAVVGIAASDNQGSGPDYTSALIRISFSPPPLMSLSPGALRSTGGANYGSLLPVNRMQSYFDPATSFVDIGFVPPAPAPVLWPERVDGVDAPSSRQRYAMHDYPVNMALYSWQQTPDATSLTPLDTLQTIIAGMRDPKQVFISWSADTRNWSTSLSGLLHISYRGH